MNESLLHNQYVFLLGGHDLEMQEIKSILDYNKLAYFDYNLEWGAKLSDYRSLFNDSRTFIGIELTQDIDPPQHYIDIEHHNENSYKNSSLEQVIELLKSNLGLEIEFTRDLQLIAANDKGYIPAMLQMGATTEEVTNIRRRDREAQGVNDEDERLAEQSILENCSNERGITMVKSLTSRFATITDQLFPYSKLLIYTNQELTCYGEGVLKLSKVFADLSNNMKVYSGGGEKGYWGISGSNIEKKLINQIIETFAMEPYSSHIFLFPFKFAVKDINNPKKGKENEIFIDYIKYSWTVNREKEPKAQINLYNEKKYFHKFVHPVLFSNLENPELIGNDSKDKSLIEKFVKDEKNLIYQIVVNKKKKDETQKHILGNSKEKDHKPTEFGEVTIDLNLKKVTLDLYQEGVGVFAFHLDYFPKSDQNEKAKLENVLLINQYGRRLFPPFLDSNFEDFNPKLTNELEGTKYRELAKSISILKGNTELKTENWSCFETKELNNRDVSNYIPKHILYFLRLTVDDNDGNKYKFKYTEAGEKPKEQNTKPKKTSAKPKNKEPEIVLIPVLDDRMFVMSWLGAEQLTEKFQNKGLKLDDEKKVYGYILSDLCNKQMGGYEAGGFYRNAEQQRSLAINRTYKGYGYATHDFWYQYVFVDGNDKTCQNDIMQEQLLEKHTYDRWVGYNTLYGISRYSFVMISPPIEELIKPWINAAFITDHFQTMYFQMVSLVLVQRAMVLKFSQEINVIKLVPTDYVEEEMHDQTLESYAKYLHFINNYFFREISTQEQGIELYDMLQDHLRVGKQAKELEKEYEEMYRLVNMAETKQLSGRMKIFAILAGLFVIPSFLLSLLNSSLFKDLQPIPDFLSNEPSWECIYLLVILIGSAFTFMNVFLNWNRKGKCRFFKTKEKRGVIFMIFGGVLIIFYLSTFQRYGSLAFMAFAVSVLYMLIPIALFLSKTKDK